MLGSDEKNRVGMSD